MRFMRLCLILTILLVVYMLGLLVYIDPYGWLIPVVLVVGMLTKNTQRFTSMGSARWANLRDIPHLLGGNGLIVGRINEKVNKLDAVKALFDGRISARDACQKFLLSCQRSQSDQLVRLNAATHTAVFAPTGVGKGVSCVIPFLLTNTDSCVVVDLKGELASVTAEARRRMGHKVVLLDPYRVVTPEPDSFNPIDFIDPDSDLALDDVRDLAAAFVVRSGMEKEAHWNDSAELWIGAMIALLVHFRLKTAGNMTELKRLLSDLSMMQQAIVKMIESDEWGGALSRLGHQLTHFQGKELNSVLTTISRHLAFVDTPAIAGSTKSSSFDPAELLTGKMTVYLILPPNRMKAQAGLLRMWISSMFAAVIRGGVQNERHIHVILDECSSLGKLEVLNDAIDKYRAFGIRLQMYFQSLGQLKACFPEDQGQTLLSNTTQVFFGVNDHETAEHVSKRLGEETIIVNEGGENSGRSTQYSDHSSPSRGSSGGASTTWKQQARRLLKPEEVTGLWQRIAITFCPGLPPLWTTLTRYYEGGFNKSSNVGRFRAVVDTASLFIGTALMAAALTVLILKGE